MKDIGEGEHTYNWPATGRKEGSHRDETVPSLRGTMEVLDRTKYLLGDGWSGASQLGLELRGSYQFINLISTYLCRCESTCDCNPDLEIMGY